MCHRASKKGAVVPAGGRWWHQLEDEYDDRSLAQVNGVINCCCEMFCKK